MAEIEPVGGTGGAPVGATPDGTTPVEATPVMGGGPSTPARPGGLVRWGIALLTLAVTVGVVSVAAALLAAGAGASAVQGWLPRDTVAYLEVRADLPGDQRAKVGDLLAKFPGFADQASLDAKIDEALERLLEGSGTSWTNDIKPWLGGEVGAAVTSAAFDVAQLPDLGEMDLDGPDLGKAPDDGIVLLVAVKDAAAAEAWVSQELGGTQTTETYADGEITIVSGLLENNLAFATRDTVLIVGPEKAVKAALDTNGSSPIASSESFTAARETAPSAYLGYAYLDLKAFVDAAAAAAGNSADVPQACLDQALAAIPAWASGSARAEDDALVFTTTAVAAGDLPAAKDSPSAVASRLPASTAVAVEIRDFGRVVVDGLAMLEEQLACDPSTAEAVEGIEQALAALGGAEALVGWADDAALAVTIDGTEFGGGLAAIVADEAAADRALDQIQSLLALGGGAAGVTSREEAYGGGTLLVVELPSDVGLAADELPELAVTVQGGVFALGTIDFVKDVVDTSGGGSLADDEVYRQAISRAGGDGVSNVFVDITAVRLGVEAMMPADEKARYETEIKPFLEPFEAFAAVAEAPGATTVSRAVITFTE
jgi:hypothetical protein